MMAVEGRPASAGPDTRRSPVTDRRAMSADTEPRTLAARKAYPEPSPEDDADAPLDLTVHTRKEITVREFARHPFADPADYVRAQAILRQSRDYLAAGRDSGTESDDSAGRLSPGEDPTSGKAYKKSLMKRYSKFTICHRRVYRRLLQPASVIIQLSAYLRPRKVCLKRRALFTASQIRDP